MTDTVTRPRLYLDEDIAVVLAQLLSARGYDCLTARDAGMLGCDDEEQFEQATALNRIFVSHNAKAFKPLADRWYAAKRSHAGIICLAQDGSVTHKTSKLAQVLDNYDPTGWRDLMTFA